MTLFCENCQKEVKVKLAYKDIAGKSRLKMFEVSCTECGALIINKKVIL